MTPRRLLWVDGAARDVFQAPKLEPWIVRYELSYFEWAAIKPLLPNKSRGVRRVNDRRVLNGIFWVLRSGAPWRDLPVCYGPRKATDRFNARSHLWLYGREDVLLLGEGLSCRCG